MYGFFENGTFISATNNWALWAALAAIVAVSVFLEQKFKWASRISAPVLAIIIGLAAANLNVIPVSADVYNISATYCIPLATAMMLYQANLKTIVKNSGKMFLCMNIGLIATFIGGLIAFFSMKNIVPESAGIAGASVGAFIGGTANFLAISNSTGLSETMISAGAFGVNFVMTIAIMVLLWMPSSEFFKKRYSHPYQTELENEIGSNDTQTIAERFWKGKEIGLLDIAKTVATAFLLVAVAQIISTMLSTVLAASDTNPVAQIPALIFGNQYVVMTVIVVIAVALVPKYFEGLKGGQEIGTFVMYLYFAVIGCSINLHDLAVSIIPTLIMILIIAVIHFAIMLIAGKIAKQNIEEMTIATNACLGGPFTAMAMATSKGYQRLIVPAMLCGIWGNALGTILGVTLVGIFSIF